MYFSFNTNNLFLQEMLSYEEFSVLYALEVGMYHMP